jgi:hypothetical protein
MVDAMETSLILGLLQANISIPVWLNQKAGGLHHVSMQFIFADPTENLLTNHNFSYICRFGFPYSSLC